MRAHISTALAACTLALAATTAQAADLSERRVPPVYLPPPIPVFTWTGFFAGANAGAAFGNGTAATPGFIPVETAGGGTRTVVVPGATDTNYVGFTGGGQIGYNYQLGGLGAVTPGLGNLGLANGGIVLGVVADAQYLDKRQAYGGSDDFLGTVRGRLGVAFERTLIYGTGGFAYDTRTTGYTFGGGIEYSFTNNMSIGAEYLRVNLKDGLSQPAAGPIPATAVGSAAATLVLPHAIGGRDQFNVVRATLNYRFSYAAVPPVVARY